MVAFLECGPFSARDGEGRILFTEASLALDDGVCAVIEGPSGGGKSTLLRHLTALNHGPASERRLLGRSYEGASLPDWRAAVTLVAQDAPMISGTVEENLRFPFHQRRGSERRFETRDALRLLEAVDLGQIPLEREVRTLSGGERHRLGLVRGLLWDPPVLVADEPVSGLDPETEQRAFDLLLGFARRSGHLAICVLHDPRLADQADCRMRLNADGLERT
jgi:putative ABC transport system ATP-binding protein